MKKLTYRQQQFLSQFLDVYRDMDQPVHYVAVAERLGIGNVTAYEMLRLLEERGLVRAEYHLDPDQRGPGRSMVLFYPTQEASRLINELAGETADLDDWRAVKERILKQLREGKAGGYEALLSDLLARIPERHSPLIYATEIITAMILTLASVQETPEAYKLMERLRRIGLPGEIGLNALGGISMALSLLERVNRRLSTLLLAQVGRYETMLSKLNEENRLRLSDFAREVASILAE